MLPGRVRPGSVSTPAASESRAPQTLDYGDDVAEYRGQVTRDQPGDCRGAEQGENLPARTLAQQQVRRQQETEAEREDPQPPAPARAGGDLKIVDVALDV